MCYIYLSNITELEEDLRGSRIRVHTARPAIEDPAAVHLHPRIHSHDHIFMYTCICIRTAPILMISHAGPWGHAHTTQSASSSHMARGRA